MRGVPGLMVEWLGRVPYAEALEVQAQAVEERSLGLSGDRLLLLEHPPVVTLGRSASPGNLRLSRERLLERGIEVHSIARGGDVTYHAPGQLVGYLLVDLGSRGERDLHLFLRRMESTLIEALGRVGLSTRRIEGRTGVFMKAEEEDPDAMIHPRKIASIGVGVRRWITFHGFALNVTNGLDGFEVIIPCGLPDVEMTSVAEELGSGPLGLDARMRSEIRASFERAFA